tara:strand:+ start:12288 stop:12662 length:375 start_codon:yes stop_codon:yes gene_type:complete
MKKSQLRQIIKEEISKVLNGGEITPKSVVSKLIFKYNAKSEIDLIKQLSDQYNYPIENVWSTEGNPVPNWWEQPISKDVWGANVLPFIGLLIGAFPPPSNSGVPPLEYVVNSIRMGTPEDLSTK